MRQKSQNDDGSAPKNLYLNLTMKVYELFDDLLKQSFAQLPIG